MPRKRNPYKLFLRGKVYYVAYRSPITGEFMTAKSTGQTTKGAAKTWAEKFQDAVIAGNVGKGSLIELLNSIFEEGSEYIKYVTDRKGAPTATLLSHKRAKIHNHIIPALEEIKIITFDKLNLEVIEKMQGSIIAKGISPKTMNEAFHNFHEAIRWALKQKLIFSDPFAGYTPYIHVKAKRGTLTYDETLKLWQCPEIDDSEKLILFLPSFTGLRTGEVQALRFGDIGEDRIHVTRAWDIRSGFKGPKGSKPGLLKERYTCLPPSLRKLMDIENHKPDELVIPPRATAMVLRNDFYNEIFYKSIAKIGISEEEAKKRNIVYYSGRHFFETFLIERNFDLLSVSHLMGHTGLGKGANPMTVNYFAAQTNFQKLNKAFESFLKGKK